MATSSNSTAAGMEGHSINRPPLFDGTNYQFWSNRMSIFMRSFDYEMWDIVVEGPYVPTKPRVGCSDLELKPRNEWTEAEVKKVQMNFKAINTLHCSLNATEFNRISTCKTAKEIWDKLKVTHEGTTQVKESKIALLSNQYEMFKMLDKESITTWFDRFTTIVNQLNQLGKIIPEDELVKRLLRSLPKAWRPTMIAIREAKDLNKISLDEICGSLLTYEQEVNQFEEEEKKKVIEKKKSLALKISSREEESYETSCEDEDAEMAMLARRYNRLAFQRDHKMGRRNFRRDRFRNDQSRNNQITCFGCKQPGHIRTECPLNREAKKDKKKKKAMVATWSDSDESSSDEEAEINIKANLCLMAKEDEVCDDDLDDYDDIQHEYDCLFNDFEKLMEKCKAYRKTIASLNLDVELAKKDYEIIYADKKNLQIDLENEKSKNEALNLELENKNKELTKWMNENSALKLSLKEIPVHSSHIHSQGRNNYYKRRNANVSCYKCGRIGHISYFCYTTVKKVWVPKGSHLLTNHQGPIKVWVPKTST